MRAAALLIFALTLGLGGAVRSAEPEPSPSQVRETVRSGLTYLQTGFTEWRNTRKCASCHHAPLLVWALDEARLKGYAVDEKQLAEVKQWSLAPESDSRIFPDPKAAPKTPADLTLAVPLTTLSMTDGRSLDAPSREGVDRMLALLRTQQGLDGSWGLSNDGGRPPISDNREVLTLWSTLALASEPAQGEAGKSALENGLKWLAANRDPQNRQSLALRLLLDVRLRQPREKIETGRKQLLALQNPDGGWSQTEKMSSDAYATGQALYVLGEAGLKAGEGAVQRASAFLVKSQESNGSWAMVSRPMLNGKSEGGATYQVPIVYAGSAWATLGLARFWPDKR